MGVMLTITGTGLFDAPPGLEPRRGARVRYPRGCRNSPLGYTPVGTP